jgi:lysophospholipase L1-like esterase
MKYSPKTFNLSPAFALMLAVLFAGSAARAQDARPVVEDKTVPKETAANPNLPTLYIVGDSTLKSNAPMRGWGQEIAPFFDPAKINVVNRAIGGRSSRTFQTEGKWDAVCAMVKPGDFILVQFGHNDVGRYDDPAAKGRPSLHGEGEDTAQVTKPDGTVETVHSFGWYMRKYGSDGKAKGARVIFCSMVPHKSWTGTTVNRGERDTYVKWTQNAAKVTGADFINLNEIVAREYEKLGPAAVESLFADKGTHTSPAGAQLSARCVVSGLRALPGAPLDRFFSSQGLSVQPVDSSLISGHN